MVGAFNRYRAMRLDGAADADIVGASLDQPSCFIAGEHDLVRDMLPYEVRIEGRDEWLAAVARSA